MANRVIGLVPCLLSVCVGARAQSCAPHQVGVFLPPGAGTDTSVTFTHYDNGLLFAGVSGPAGGLYILDPSDPGQIAVLAHLPLGGRAGAIEVAGSRVYTTDAQGQLVVIDVSNPASPALLGSLAGPFFPAGISVDGGLAAMVDFDSLIVVDASDPGQPVVLSSMPLPSSHSVVLRGTVCLVTINAAQGGPSLVSVDLSDPSVPVTQSGLTIETGSCFAHGIDRVGGMAAFVCDREVFVVDASSPGAVAIAGSAATLSVLESARLVGTTLYIGGGFGRNGGGLHVFDVRDPAQLELIGFAESPKMFTDIAVGDGLAFLPALGAGLLVYDVNGCETGEPCLADANDDGVLSPNDFSAWVSVFNSGRPGCDQNGDGLCTTDDFTAWVSNFNSGC